MCKFIQNSVSMLLIFRYMVDAADREKVEASRNELHNLLDKPQLQGIPVSVPLKPLSKILCDFCTSHAKLYVGAVGDHSLLLQISAVICS